MDVLAVTIVMPHAGAISSGVFCNLSGPELFITFIFFLKNT